jgi:NADPH2:quinone reductase
VVSVSVPPDPAAFEQQGVSASYVFVLPDGDELRALAALAETGELRVNLEQTFSFDEASRAHELVEAGHVRGKLALIPA